MTDRHAARSRISKLLLLALFAGIALTDSQALMLPFHSGCWPQSWPVELEPFRERSRTMNVYGGWDTQVFSIPFESREEFESVWPVLLRLKSKGAPIRITDLESQTDYAGSQKWDPKRPMVRIIAPPYTDVYGEPPQVDDAGHAISTERIKLWWKSKKGETLTRKQRSILKADDIVGDPTRLDVESMKENDGTWLRAGAPWPDCVYDERGELPEYIGYEKIDGRLQWTRHAKNAYVRCRIELELVVDGKIIDLDRLEIPADTPIIDKRNAKSAQAPERG
jgi:hypothetical protein